MPLLGPFEPVPGLLERALARDTRSHPTSLPVLVLMATLVGQWTVALELVLTEPTYQTDPALRQLVLERAYAGWWQGLGVSDYLEVERVPC